MCRGDLLFGERGAVGCGGSDVFGDEILHGVAAERGSASGGIGMTVYLSSEA